MHTRVYFIYLFIFKLLNNICSIFIYNQINNLKDQQGRKETLTVGLIIVFVQNLAEYRN